MAKANRSGLGRGLSSLMGGSEGSAQRSTNRQTVDFDESILDEQNYGNPSPIDTLTSSRDSSAHNDRAADSRHEQAQERVEEEDDSPQDEASARPAAHTARKREDRESTDEVPILQISPNPDQPRSNFDEEELEELSKSIEKDGLLQPILVRKMDDGTYQIIAGERRWQASKLAGLKTVPVRIKDADDDTALELALIENLQRSDLNPIEEAYGYRRLMERKKMTQADIAQAMSKGRSTVANALRLLDLPEEAQQLLYEDKITAGHARAILSVPTKEGRDTLTNKLIDNKLSVRETEAMARLLSNKPASQSKKEPVPPVYKSIAKALKDILQTNVKVKSSKGKNKIEIEFKDEEDLRRIFDEMVGEED